MKGGGPDVRVDRLGLLPVRFSKSSRFGFIPEPGSLHPGGEKQAGIVMLTGVEPSGHAAHPVPCWPPLVPLPLNPLEVRVWCASAPGCESKLTELKAVLSEEEVLRSERFRFDKDRLSYVVSHAMLRIVLGKALRDDPSSFCFGTEGNGKPFLSDPRPSEHRVRFNLSHSHGITLLAVCLDLEVGVDVEQVRPTRDVTEIVDRFFASSESIAFKAIAPSRKTETFFRAWTRKEAILKGLGVGITQGLDKAEVSFSEDGDPRVIRLDPAWGDATQWRLWKLDPAPGFCAALACKTSGAGVRVGLGSWQP